MVRATANNPYELAQVGIRLSHAVIRAARFRGSAPRLCRYSAGSATMAPGRPISLLTGIAARHNRPHTALGRAVRYTLDWRSDPWSRIAATRWIRGLLALFRP